MKSLIIFASGGGTNAQAIIDYFKNRQDVTISLLVCNKAQAGVLDRAKKAQIPIQLIDRERFKSEAFLNQLKVIKPDLIVLAGFLWRIPEGIVRFFHNQIINLHPALLPKYGGKGMYGHHVHEAVKNAKENESGITIHYVNEFYDEGRILLQARCQVLPEDSPESIAQKIHQLEHFHLPRLIDFLLFYQS